MKTPEKKPRVSIGMPVYNGEKYVGKAIESLLAQTFKDFELIISDNASTDLTEQICRQYAKKDARIRYYRNEKNLGAARNFNRVFELSSAEYFKWAGHDDSWAPEYLEQCVDMLEEHPSAILCYCQSIYFDDEGKFFCLYDKPHGVNSSKAHERFRRMLWTRSRLDPIYAVVRRESLKKTGLVRNILGTDDIFALELSLVGPFCFIPKTMVYRCSEQSRDYQEHLIRIDPDRKSVRFAFSRRCYEYLQLINHASVTNSQRIYLYLETLLFFVSRQLERRTRWLWQNWMAIRSPDKIAGSRFVNVTLRLAAFRRFARKTKWPELSQFLANLSASSPIGLWCAAAQVLASRPEKGAQQMLAEWVEDLTEFRRIAAISAMAENPRRWQGVLRSRLALESSSRVKKVLDDVISKCSDLKDLATDKIGGSIDTS